MFLKVRKQRRAWCTHPFPDMLDLRSHHVALRVLVSYPVLSAAIDDTTAGTLQHIAERGAEQQAVSVT